MKLKFGVYNQWKKLKTSLFIIKLFEIGFYRMLDYYRISVTLLGFEFMIEKKREVLWGDKNRL